MSTFKIDKSDNKINITVDDGVYFNYFVYLDGYFKATDILLSRLNETDNFTVIFPLLFNFSHYMELWIKILNIFADEEKTIKEIGIGNHGISSIIANSKTMLERKSVSIDDLVEIEKALKYFNAFIKDGVSLSEAMRYPTGNKSKELIIIPSALDNTNKDDYAELTNKITELLELTNKITKDYFIHFFENKLKYAEVTTHDQL